MAAYMMIMEEQSEAWTDTEALARARHRLPIALLGNAFMRIAGGASGVLVGLYLADLAGRGRLCGGPFGVGFSRAVELDDARHMDLGDGLLRRRGFLAGAFLCVLAGAQFSLDLHVCALQQGGCEGGLRPVYNTSVPSGLRLVLAGRPVLPTAFGGVRQGSELSTSAIRLVVVGRALASVHV